MPWSECAVVANHVLRSITFDYCTAAYVELPINNSIDVELNFVVVNDVDYRTAGVRIDGGTFCAEQHNLETFGTLNHVVLNDFHRHEEAGLASGDRHGVRE